jgi:phospholipid-binding lipoprotein MlaA
VTARSGSRKKTPDRLGVSAGQHLPEPFPVAASCPRLLFTLRAIVLGSLALAVSACATQPPADDKEAVAAYNEANDPFEPLNRYFFEVNLGIDKLLLRPVAEIYRGVTPQLVQDGVRNGLNNLNTPLTFVHDLLQGEEQRASDSTGRFLTNTVLGVGGVFDVAAGEGEMGRKNGIPYHSEDMGQTLAVYGIEPGPYLMLPLVGPSNVRDAIGRIGDSFIDPVQFIVKDEHRLGFGLTRRVLRTIDTRARNIEALDDIERDAIDYYATVRSLYRQYRASEIANGRAVKSPMPGKSGKMNFDEFDEDEEPKSEQDVPKSSGG